MGLYNEKLLCERFLRDRIVRLKVEDRFALTEIRNFIINTTGLPSLDIAHEKVSVEKLNEFRLLVMQAIHKKAWFSDYYLRLAKEALSIIVGNEMAQQRRVNLSIQLPHDSSSLLPVHCDTWSGDSPFEVVLWVPLVNCYGTKAMFYCSPDADARIQPEIGKYQNSEKLYEAIEKHTNFIECNYGDMLIFTQNVMHGNRVNETGETRWSMNCRFKGLMTPYADKKLGEFFEPVSLRPATQLGMGYEFPRI